MHGRPVEEARWRTSAKGRRYLMATISDAVGQYEATAFDDEPCADLEARGQGGACGLMTVELDRRPGDDTPRVTVKRFQPLDSLAKRTRLHAPMRIAAARSSAGRPRAGQRRGGNGVVALILPVSDGAGNAWSSAAICKLDADLAARLTRILGEGRSSSARRSRRGSPWSAGFRPS